MKASDVFTGLLVVGFAVLELSGAYQTAVKERARAERERDEANHWRGQYEAVREDRDRLREKYRDEVAKRLRPVPSKN